MTHDPWMAWADAPKTGEEILAYNHNQKVYLLVSWNTMHKYWQSKGEPKLGLEHQGCVWRPLPKYEVASLMVYTGLHKLDYEKRRIE